MKLTKIVTHVLVYFFIVHASFVYAMDTEYMSSSSLNSTSGELLLDDAFMAPLNIFPRIIVDWCIENESRYHTHKLLHYAYKLSHNKAFSKFGEPSLYPFIDICEKLHLSPATLVPVLSTCEAIVNRQPFNPEMLEITYDSDKELHNKLAFINQMPRIIADIARKKPDNYYVTKLTRIMFAADIDVLKLHDAVDPNEYWITPQQAVTRDVRFLVANFLLESFVHRDAYISPHTVSCTVQEMCDWVFERKPVSSEQYDERVEIEKGRSIMRRFPSILTDIFFHKDGHKRRLVAYAYMLQYPQEQEVIEKFMQYHCFDENDNKNNYRSEIEHHIKQVLEKEPDSYGPLDRIAVVKDEATAKSLTDQFIATFTATQISQSIQLLPSAQALPLS